MKRTALWFVCLFAFAMFIISFPRLHEKLGPKFYGRYVEIDINTGRVRHRVFVLGIGFTRLIEETAVSKAIDRISGGRLRPHWIEASVRAGLGDYYPRPRGGKLLADVKQLSVIIEAMPQKAGTNDELISEIAAALKRADHDSLERCSRALLDNNDGVGSKRR